jgi:FMN phosphatase YigB (HAD superfamily)
LGILSNTCPSHWHYVTQRYRALLSGPFSVFALSYELKSCKPDRAIFTGSAKLAGVEPHEIFYTDDIPGLIAGAKAAVYDAVPFTSVREYVRELTARGIRINY